LLVWFAYANKLVDTNYAPNPESRRTEKADPARVGLSVGRSNLTTVRESSEFERLQVLGLLEEFEALLSVTTEGLILVDLGGQVVRINPGLLALTGYQAEEILGKPFEALKIFDPSSFLDILPKLNVVLSGQRVSPFRVQVICKSGRTMDFYLHMSPWRRSDGNAGIVVLLRRASESKDTSPILPDSEERFRDLVETTSDWVWEMNEKGVYTYVSPKVADILGYQPEEVVGKSQFDFMPLEEARKAVETVNPIMASQKPFKFVQIRKLHRDGRQVFLETSGVPFFGPDGRLEGYRGIHRDITERRKAEETVKQTYDKLESTVESVIKAIALTVEMRDRYTAGHQQRVKQLGGAIARQMALPPDKLQIIRVAGLLHDLGKIFVPAEILTKPGSLTEVEFAIIKQHPQSAYDILRSIEFPWPIADVVFQHHERMDGSGYPRGLQDSDIVTEAKILAVADVVEAMTFHRAYRPALGLEAALKEIVKKKQELYDPDVVEACLSVFLDHGFQWEQV